MFHRTLEDRLAAARYLLELEKEFPGPYLVDNIKVSLVRLIIDYSSTHWLIILGPP